jgi:hypothetical protein
VLREVTGQDAARAVPGIEDLTITAEPGDTLVPLPEGTRYVGFLIARARAPEQVEAALREAHRQLGWIIDAQGAEPAADDARVSAHGKRTIRF